MARSAALLCLRAQMHVLILKGFVSKAPCAFFVETVRPVLYEQLSPHPAALKHTGLQRPVQGPPASLRLLVSAGRSSDGERVCLSPALLGTQFSCVNSFTKRRVRTRSEGV